MARATFKWRNYVKAQITSSHTTCPHILRHGGTAVASATVDISPATDGLILTRHVVNKTSTANFIDTTKEIGRCQVGTTGGTCTIQSGKTVTRTIQLTTGVTRWSVASSLSISSASSVTTSQSCTSPVMRAGEAWIANPIGTRFRYQIETRGRLDGAPIPPKRSGYLYAFNPTGSIYCKLIG